MLVAEPVSIRHFIILLPKVSETIGTLGSGARCKNLHPYQNDQFP